MFDVSGVPVIAELKAQGKIVVVSLLNMDYQSKQFDMFVALLAIPPDEVIFSKDRAGLTTACKALDRALIWNHYVVPHWYVPYERTARWDRFGKPDKLPDYSIGFPTIWWWDEERAKKAGKG